MSKISVASFWRINASTGPNPLIAAKRARG